MQAMYWSQNNQERYKKEIPMLIRHALPNDLPRILSIYEKARTFMASYGNASQWANGYPQEELLRNDLQYRRLYVCTENDRLAAVFMFFIGTEPTYEIIENGSWLNDRSYGTIHRLACSGLVPHAADFVIGWCLERCSQSGADLRGDTHEKNLPMQKAFERNGFIRCGTIHVRDGSPRIAYQKEYRSE